MAWSKFVDMSLTDEQRLDTVMPIPSEMPEYPYGLRICLTQDELEKLDLDDECDVGDVIDLRAFARVTSVSSHQDGNGKRQCRIELMIEQLAVENESTEDPDEE